jgi:hypothetical protein
VLFLCLEFNLENTIDPCGSGLARDSGGSVAAYGASDTVIAGKPAPTGFSGAYKSPFQAQKSTPKGASF